MSLSKITLVALASLAVLSTLVAKLQNIVHVSNDIEYEYEEVKRELEDRLFPGDRLRHLMWFLQISDLHLSLFQDKSRGSDLRKFCKETVSVIQPSVVLATGDLVDARTNDILGSRQFPEEWEMYWSILNETGVTSNTTWLDIRGNHDNFNVKSLDSKDDFFRKYSVQGAQHRRSYRYTLHHDTEVYDFIGIDACMNPGPKRPFNFLGVLEKEEFSHIQNLAEGAQDNNFTIWFGHYPTSTIVAPHPGVREFMRHSGPYLCGHLHTLGGMVPQMYTLQPQGNLELELADWKENRKYRICAVDHGIFSFTDHYLNQWPLILITNPKEALMTMPTIEPLYRISKSTHIRALVFSPHLIVSVKFQLDGGQWTNMNSSDSPLYTAQWEPMFYEDGLHSIAIHARDIEGNEQTKITSFALDGSRPKFPLGARLALRGHISVGQIIFGSVLLITLMPLCVLRICLCFGKGDMIQADSEKSCCCRLLFKLSLLASIDMIFWPIVFGALYVAIGPWFVGYIIDDQVSVCFIWGIFIGSKFLPGGLTYFAGIVYLITFYIPFILCLSHCVYHQHRSAIAPTRSSKCKTASALCRHSTMLLFLAWQTAVAVGYFYSYGTMVLLLGFVHSWSVLAAMLLWCVVLRLPESRLRHGLGLAVQRNVGTPLLPSGKAPLGRSLDVLSPT
ncbi:transmembrane protein 62-like [Uloborus diversus]|uniref:transmembrane protein 62-like n=1 Tax=Uloborus diversus TaxID=327109 RepID=UPI002409315A|nr:transmembrane protein 62-like [Uloborus diversus]